MRSFLFFLLVFFSTETIPSYRYIDNSRDLFNTFFPIYKRRVILIEHGAHISTTEIKLQPMSPPILRIDKDTKESPTETLTLEALRKQLPKKITSFILEIRNVVGSTEYSFYAWSEIPLAPVKQLN